MNRKIYSILAIALICLVFGLLTGCSSSSTPPPTIAITTASGSTPQTQTITEAFGTALGVNVTSNGAAASGVTVTFAPGTSSGGATCALSATTATTDSNGNVLSQQGHYPFGENWYQSGATPCERFSPTDNAQ